METEKQHRKIREYCINNRDKCQRYRSERVEHEKKNFYKRTKKYEQK